MPDFMNQDGWGDSSQQTMEEPQAADPSQLVDHVNEGLQAEQALKQFGDQPPQDPEGLGHFAALNHVAGVAGAAKERLLELDQEGSLGGEHSRLIEELKYQKQVETDSHIAEQLKTGNFKLNSPQDKQTLDNIRTSISEVSTDPNLTYEQKQYAVDELRNRMKDIMRLSTAIPPDEMGQSPETKLAKFKSGLSPEDQKKPWVMGDNGPMIARGWSPPEPQQEGVAGGTGAEGQQGAAGPDQQESFPPPARMPQYYTPLISTKDEYERLQPNQPYKMPDGRVLVKKPTPRNMTHWRARQQFGDDFYEKHLKDAALTIDRKTGRVTIDKEIQSHLDNKAQRQEEMRLEAESRRTKVSLMKDIAKSPDIQGMKEDIPKSEQGFLPGIWSNTDRPASQETKNAAIEKRANDALQMLGLKIPGQSGGGKKQPAGGEQQPKAQAPEPQQPKQQLPVVSSDEEFAKVKSGEEFLDKNGKKWRKK